MQAAASGSGGRGYILYGFAVGFGAITATLGILQLWMPLVIIPLIAYILASVLNILAQKTICSNVNVGQAFKLGTVSAASIVLVYLAANNIHILGQPIRTLLPNADPGTQRRFILAFYLFWAGLYSQILSGGFMQVCN